MIQPSVQRFIYEGALKITLKTKTKRDATKIFYTLNLSFTCHYSLIFMNKNNFN